MTMSTIGRNALGDPRAVYRREQCYDDSWEYLAGQARYQRELRAMIPPGGRRALYLDHLHELADDSGALLTLYHPKGFIARWKGETRRWGDRVTVTTPLPLTRGHYLTGLHEFGHVYQPESGGSGLIAYSRTPFGCFDDACRGVYGELMAYVWAFQRSRIPIVRDDVCEARDIVMAHAKDGGWEGGPVEEWVRTELRQQYLDGVAQLEAALGGDA
jgi:hypothetical protein